MDEKTRINIALGPAMDGSCLCFQPNSLSNNNSYIFYQLADDGVIVPWDGDHGQYTFLQGRNAAKKYRLDPSLHVTSMEQLMDKSEEIIEMNCKKKQAWLVINPDLTPGASMVDPDKPEFAFGQTLDDTYSTLYTMDEYNQIVPLMCPGLKTTGLEMDEAIAVYSRLMQSGKYQDAQMEDLIQTARDTKGFSFDRQKIAQADAYPNVRAGSLCVKDFSGKLEQICHLPLSDDNRRKAAQKLYQIVTQELDAFSHAADVCRQCGKDSPAFKEASIKAGELNNVKIGYMENLRHADDISMKKKARAVKAAGLQPSRKLCWRLLRLDRIMGHENTLKELSLLYKARQPTGNPEADQLIASVGKDLCAQQIQAAVPSCM